MLDYGFFGYASKEEFLAKSKEYWNPGKTQFWQEAGVDLVIDRREGYFFYDMTGARLIDLHLNGGTYNLGHRNPELIAALETRDGALRHRQPPLPRAGPDRAGRGARRKRHRRTCATSSTARGGGEAIDIAIKTARHTKQRRKIVSIVKGYHGHTGLAVAAGDDRFSKTLPVRPARGVRPGAVQRPRGDGGGALGATTSPP